MTIKTESDYRALLASLCAKAPGEYVTDECVDRENVLVCGMTENARDYWSRMCDAAISAAQIRLQDMGKEL